MPLYVKSNYAVGVRMLEYIRDKSQSLGVKLAFGLIILVFVFWGVGNFNDRSAGTLVAVVNGDPDRLTFVIPDFTMPEGGLNIRLGDTPVQQEARMIDYKRWAAEAFSRANRIDRKVWGKPGAKIGFVARISRMR